MKHIILYFISALLLTYCADNITNVTYSYSDTTAYTKDIRTRYKTYAGNTILIPATTYNDSVYRLIGGLHLSDTVINGSNIYRVDQDNIVLGTSSNVRQGSIAISVLYKAAQDTGWLYGTIVKR